MSSWVHVDNKMKDISIFDKGLAQGLNNTTFTADKNYLINFTESRDKFC